MNMMSKTKPIPFCLVLFALNLLFFAPFVLTAKPSIKLGVDYLEETGFEVLKGKRVGLLTHPAGKNGRGQSTVEVLFRSRVVNLVALFGPEHGIFPLIMRVRHRVWLIVAGGMWSRLFCVLTQNWAPVKA